jgi:hypothetical protein
VRKQKKTQQDLAAVNLTLSTNPSKYSGHWLLFVYSLSRLEESVKDLYI